MTELGDAERATAGAGESALLAVLETLRRVRGARGGGSLAVVEKTLAGGAVTPLHVHQEDELFYVLEGAMTIHAGDRAVRVAAGEAFLAPKQVPHTSTAETDQVRYLAMAFVTSVGRYEEFLRAIGQTAESAASRAKGWPCTEELAGLTTIAAANGITILGQPGTLPGDVDTARGHRSPEAG
jgi:quercetin dioxygenase-like cupin family protein